MPLPLFTDSMMATLYHQVGERLALPLLAQIEAAGGGLAALAWQQGAAEGPVIVLAGPGNKGAVGLAAARRLHEQGATVRLVLARPPAALHAMAAHQYQTLQAMGLVAWGLALSEGEMQAQEPIPWTEAALLIDALLGSGLASDPRGECVDLIRIANSTRRPILAWDQPSGLGGDEGVIWSPCIDATMTLVPLAPRVGLVAGWPVVGEVWRATLGLTPAQGEQLGLPGEIWVGEAIERLGSARQWRDSPQKGEE